MTISLHQHDHKDIFNVGGSVGKIQSCHHPHFRWFRIICSGPDFNPGIERGVGRFVPAEQIFPRDQVSSPPSHCRTRYGSECYRSMRDCGKGPGRIHTAPINYDVNPVFASSRSQKNAAGSRIFRTRLPVSRRGRMTNQKSGIPAGILGLESVFRLSAI